MNKIAALLVLYGCLAVLTNSALAEDHATQALNESGQASGHSAGSTAHALVTSGQAATAVVAVPMVSGVAAVGASGMTGQALAHGSQKSAAAPAHAPLPVTREVLTIAPPNQALQRNR
jgi:hypothetical protein